MTTDAGARTGITSPLVPADLPADLPGAARVLAVTARPGQESAELGALLQAFRRAGASTRLLCLTGGAGRPEGGTGAVAQAAAVLGVGAADVAGYRRADLPRLAPSELVGRIGQALGEHSADLLLVIAPETGDIADAAAARASMAAALRSGVPVAARTAARVPGAWPVRLEAGEETVRAVQRAAVASHAGDQATFRGLAGRISPPGTPEMLRWLVSPARVPAPRPVSDLRLP
jgi:LmbE family N-acetylglucosaminyl deacetylase